MGPGGLARPADPWHAKGTFRPEPAVTDSTLPSPTTKPPLKERFQTLLKEYGKVALVIHFSFFFLAILGFWLAIKFGFPIDGISSTAGTLGAAYAATQVIKPLRLIATMVLTPLVARLIGHGKPERVDET